MLWSRYLCGGYSVECRTDCKYTVNKIRYGLLTLPNGVRPWQWPHVTKEILNILWTLCNLPFLNIWTKNSWETDCNKMTSWPWPRIFFKLLSSLPLSLKIWPTVSVMAHFMPECSLWAWRLYTSSCILKTVWCILCRSFVTFRLMTWHSTSK